MQCYAAFLYDGGTGIGRALDLLDKLGIAENTIVIFTSDNGPQATTSEK